MSKDTTVTRLFPDLHLSDVQKHYNYMALQPRHAFVNGEGMYASRTDIGMHLGWLMLPCVECGNAVRTMVDVDAEGESPVAHISCEGAYYEDDFVTCRPCVEDGRWLPTGKVAA